MENKELEKQNRDLKAMIERMASRIYEDNKSDFNNTEEVKRHYFNEVYKNKKFHNTCTEIEQKTCDVEKLGCNGCYYHEEEK